KVAAIAIALQEENLADAALFYEIHCRGAIRIVTQLKAGLEDSFSGGAGVGDLAAILRRKSHRLFTVDVLSDLERGDGHLFVEVHGRGDHDGVDIFPLEQLAIFGIGVGRVPCGGRLGDSGLKVVRIDIADGDHFDTGDLEHVPLEERAAVSYANEGDTHGVV